MSEQTLGILFVVGIVAIIIALAVYAHKKAEKRKLAIEAWAKSQSFGFTRDRDPHFGARFPFSGLNTGDRRYAHNISTGQRSDYVVRAFDYHYVTYSTDSKGRRQTHTHQFSAVIIGTEYTFKPLNIRSENFFDKIGEFIGFDDIDFELAEFSREFHVKSPDRKWAFDVLHQDSMEFLLASPRFQVEFLDSFVMVRRRWAFNPEEFGPALDVAAGLVDRLPQSVVRELKGQA